jgi:hypothetical protein
MAYFSPKQVDQLKASNLAILEALARYRYLTTRQIIALGIARHRSSVYQIMRRFEGFSKPLIERSKFSVGVEGRGGRQPMDDLITLTRRGAEFLHQTHPEHGDDLRFVQSKGVAVRDYEHTKETVDFHILVDQFAALYGCTVDCFHTYHDHTGANHGKDAAQGINRLRRQTTFEVNDNGTRHTFSADAVCHLTDPTGAGHLFAVEVQRGQDTGRLCDKLREHYIPALAEGTISAAYGIQSNATILILCENPSLMKHTLERLAADPEFAHFHDCFAFHTIAELQGIAEDSPPPHPLTFTTRQHIAAALKDKPDWLQIMNDDSRFAAHPKRLATGWRFIGGKVGTVF